jgi:hypothetical protein
MYSARRSFADPYGEINDMFRKPREMSEFGKKSAKVYHFSYSSLMQLQVALCTYMLHRLGLKVHKNENFFGFDFEIRTVSLLVMLQYEGFVKKNF